MKWISILFHSQDLIVNPFDSQDQIINSPLKLLHISLWSGNENLVLDQDKNFYLISLNILITYLLVNVEIL